MKEIKTKQPKLQLNKKTIAKLSSQESKKVLAGDGETDGTGYSVLAACDIINVIQSALLGKGFCKPK